VPDSVEYSTCLRGRLAFEFALVSNFDVLAIFLSAGSDGRTNSHQEDQRLHFRHGSFTNMIFRSLFGGKKPSAPQPGNEPIRVEKNPDDSLGTDLDSDPRPHHYAFAHRVLPALFLDDPDDFLSVMLGPSGPSLVAELWSRVGEREAPDAILPSNGLCAEEISCDGRTGALITLPEARGMAEAHFIVLLGPSVDDEPRFFVLEKTEMESRWDGGGERAVLCEWLAGRNRRNHERIIPPVRAIFLNEVASQLSEERERQLAGARPGAAAWNVSTRNLPPEEVEYEKYRLQPCLFAFHLLPKALLEDHLLLPDADADAAQKLVDELWARATFYCTMGSEPNLPASECPRASFHQTPAGRYLVIEMASAFHAPEPLYIAAKAADPGAVFMVESAGIRPDKVFVTSITEDGEHAILDGTLDVISLDSFLQAFTGPGERPELPHSEASNILKHLTAYAAIYRRAEELI
jgi:hypothetical protein